jgi:hypothetical protein
MMIDPLWELKARQERIWQEKQQILLVQEAARYRKKMRDTRPGFHARLLLKVGDVVIDWGLHLKRHYELRFEALSPPKM